MWNLGVCGVEVKLKFRVRSLCPPSGNGAQSGWMVHALSPWIFSMDFSHSKAVACVDNQGHGSGQSVKKKKKL